MRLARYVPLRRFVHPENKKLGVSATFLRLGALFCPLRAVQWLIFSVFTLKFAIRELAAIANRKKVTVRAVFLFLISQDVLKAVPWMGLIWRA